MGSDGWDGRLADLDDRVGAARAMGGEQRLARQHTGGRLDARARVDTLLDPGTFAELGTLAGPADVAADGFVAGSGRIDGRPVLVGAEDFTVLGGSIGVAGHAKRHRLTELAGRERVPLVLLLDGAGERAQNALTHRDRSPTDLQGLVALSGSVPTVAVVHGPSAGHGALAAPLADWCLMVEGSALFAAGPPLVAAATGEQVDKETLGGVAVHVEESGVAHDAAPDDLQALAQVRRYLSYFPSSAWEPISSLRTAGRGDGPRRLDAVTDLVPTDQRRPYDMGAVVAEVVDEGSWMELGARRGGSVLCGLARLGGWPVALVANQPAVRAGAFDGPACDKAARFLEVAGGFRLPVVFLADNPGVLAGSAAERSGLLRRAARLYAAQARLPGPKLHVTLRKAYGFGSSLMAMNPFDDQTLSLAFPGVQLGAMPAGGAGSASGAGADTQAQLDEAEVAGGYRAAERFSYDEVIDPRDLRNRLLAALDLSVRRMSAVPDGPVLRQGSLP
jgi:acetyl-CoA carboxylase carboxyltransferase component